MTNTQELTQEQKLAVMALREEGMSREDAIAEVTGCKEPEVEHVDAKPPAQEEEYAEIEAEVVEDEPEQAVVPAAPQRSAITPVQHTYTPDEIDTIRNTVAKGADNNELAMFLHICQVYGLDPFLKEIYYSKEMKTIMSSRDGYLKVAQRDEEFKGMKSAVVFENDAFSMDIMSGIIEHKFKATDRGKIVGAWAMVLHKSREPVMQYVPFSEYDQGRNTWKKYPSAMILKCAEALALKRQFGISGLVTQEEMGGEQ